MPACFYPTVASYLVRTPAKSSLAKTVARLSDHFRSPFPNPCRASPRSPAALSPWALAASPTCHCHRLPPPPDRADPQTSLPPQPFLFISLSPHSSPFHPPCSS